MSTASRIPAAYDDGIGPEIMSACLHVTREAGARLETDALLGRVLDQSVEIVKTETLRTFDVQAGYTLSQGQ